MRKQKREIPVENTNLLNNKTQRNNIKNDTVIKFPNHDNDKDYNTNIAANPEHYNNLKFKNQNWSANHKNKEKTNRNPKNIKNLMIDNLDSLSLNVYNNLEAGPSVLPKKKYCDITGLESKYIDPRSGLRYYNSDIFKLIQNFTEPIKNQYLSIRKALFVIK